MMGSSLRDDGDSLTVIGLRALRTQIDAAESALHRLRAHEELLAARIRQEERRRRSIELREIARHPDPRD